jgi:5'-3' exonuclease
VKVLILDGYNLMYRAYHGNRFGQHHTIFNFFRSLRPIVEKFSPDKAYFVIEGVPVDNIELHAGYKSNRQRAPGLFTDHKNVCIELIQSSFPIAVIRHPNFEADDVVDGIIRYWHSTDDVTIVSTDTDFIQILNEFQGAKLWNPIKKQFIGTPEYDYVTWKALRGDSADAIPGIRGVGDKTAEKMVNDTSLLEAKLAFDNNRQLFERNLALIRFSRLEEEMDVLEVSTPEKSWEHVRSTFKDYEFNSIVNEKSWTKFVNTFDSLWSIGN